MTRSLYQGGGGGGGGGGCTEELECQEMSGSGIFCLLGIQAQVTPDSDSKFHLESESHGETAECEWESICKHMSAFTCPAAWGHLRSDLLSHPFILSPSPISDSLILCLKDFKHCYRPKDTIPC